MDLKLFKAMIFVCNKQADFITPLIKLMASWESNLDQESQLKKKHDIIQYDQSRNDRIRIGNNILAYIRMLLKGHSITGEKMH